MSKESLNQANKEKYEFMQEESADSVTTGTGARTHEDPINRVKFEQIEGNVNWVSYYL